MTARTPFAHPEKSKLHAPRVLARVTDHMRDVFWIRPRDGATFYYVSAAYERIWGRTVESLYREPGSWMDAVAPEDQDRVRQFVATESGTREIEFRITRPDGEARFLRLRCFGTEYCGDERIKTGLAEDVTGRRVLEERRAQHRAEQRRSLVREVHHRIKNNLQGVVGLLLRRASNSPEAAPALLDAVTQVSAIAATHGLHGQVGRHTLRLCDMVEEVARAVSSTFGIPLEVSLPAWRSIEIADDEEVPIALIVNELVTNAVRHRDEESATRTTVQVAITPESACLLIRNPGRIPENFDPRTSGGTGLSLVRALMPCAGASLTMVNDGGAVETRLLLSPPVVSIIAPPQAIDATGAVPEGFA